jgi:exopolysaccharide production protein ExoY
MSKYVLNAEDIAIVGGKAKRVFDISAAALAILFIAPLLLGIALLIVLIDGRPIFIRHDRIGRAGVPFPCFKFRTMVRNANEVLEKHIAINPEAAHEWQQMRKLKIDPRITSLGAVLRKSSVDELPQLINILKGEMSFVGPRPIVGEEIERYGQFFSSYEKTRPGLTGPWQISGRNDVSYRERVLLDHDYAENWSFSKDFVILLKTVPAVLRSRGSY